MPKIEIREIDNTTPGTLDENFDVVYIPGFVNLSSVDADAVIKPGVPTLFTSLKSFTTQCGTAPARFGKKQYYQQLTEIGDGFAKDSVPFTGVMFEQGDPDPSYIMAKELLAAGMNVVYERVNEDSDVSASTIKVNPDNLTKGYTYRVNIPAARPIFSPVVPVLFPHLDSPLLVSEIKDTDEYYYCVEKYKLDTSSTDMTQSKYDSLTEFEKTYAVVTGEALKDNSTTYGVDTLTNNVKAFTSASNVYKLVNKFYKVGETEASEKVPLVYDRDGNLIVKNVPAVDTENPITAYPKDWNVCYYKDYYEVITVSFDATYNTDFTFSDTNLDNYLRAGLASGSTVVQLLSTATCTCNEIVESVSITKMYSALYDIFSVSDDKTDGIIDRGNFNIKYLTSGGYPTFEYSGNALVSKMLALAEKRGDCIALIDHTDNDDRETNVDKSASVYQSVLNTFDGTNGEFGAMFTPWCEFNRLTSDVESANVKPVDSVRLGGSFAYLGALADSIKTNAPWLAIAGATRGKVQNLRNNSIKPLITNGAADYMQPRTNIAVNAITDIKPYGNVIWGNRTLKKNEENLVATSFLNIRNLVCDVKKICYRTARKLTFEQNNDILWINFKSMIAPTLDRMVSGYGISGYKFVRDNEHEKASAKATLCAKIFLYPVEPVEDFYITIMLEDDEVTVQ